MPHRIVPIVEGDGEVAAAPILIRRIASELGKHLEVTYPIRVPAQRFLRDQAEFERYLLLAAALTEGNGTILILLDLDDGCPAIDGPVLLDRAQQCLPHVIIRVVFAHREFESWFLYSIESLRGKRNLRDDLVPPDDIDRIRGAKGWLDRHLVDPRHQAYGEVLDQPALTAAMDLSAARRSDSFDKLWREIQAITEAHTP